MSFLLQQVGCGVGLGQPLFLGALLLLGGCTPPPPRQTLLFWEQLWE